MRDYAKTSPRFWTRGSGKRLRGDHEAQVVAQYLLSGPESNMIGLYHLTLPALAHHIGSPLEGASKALRRVCAEGFAAYDDENELVWVFNAAKIEFGDGLKLGDKRISGIAKQLQTVGNHPFVRGFLHLYGEAYRVKIDEIEASPFEAPLEALASPLEGASQQDQKQKQKQKQEQKYIAPVVALTLTAPPSAPAVVEKKRSPDQKARSIEVNRRYRERYAQTVGKPPSGVDQAFNGMIARFADKHAENALAIVDQYFDSPNGFYRLKGWPVQLLLDSAPALWREVDDARAAQENLAAPAQQRIDARNASADLELEKAKEILAQRRASR